jgi:16S rRNA processing protein RimM
MPDRIAVGIIRKAHGVRGEASIEPWTDSVERFEELENVTLVSPDEKQTREARIEAMRPHGERALVKFSGIETPEEVQKLHGWTIEIPAEEARSLDEDEYFLHDLTGLTLIDAAGRQRGIVIEAYEGGSGIMLDVRRPDGKTFELPFAAGICTSIDLEAKTMTVELPEGIEDLEKIPE